MGKKTKGIIGACLALILSSCTTPGTYFDSTAALTPIKTLNKMATPVVIPINSSLYQAAQLPDASDTLKSLWYKNNYSYKIGNDDVLKIIVWDHPELNSPSVSPLSLNSTTAVNYSANSSIGIPVNNHGNIYFPYSGTTHVRGDTIEQARNTITQKLSHFIKNPQVTLQVLKFRSQSISIMGAINKPSTLPISNYPLTIFDAINQSGGINKSTADTSKIFIIRGKSNKPDIFILNAQSPSNLLVAEKFKLYPNDIIYVPTTKLTNWNRIISNLLPSLQTAVTTTALKH
jgi:polysaccharide biosynthesis/export protein